MRRSLLQAAGSAALALVAACNDAPAVEKAAPVAQVSPEPARPVPAPVNAAAAVPEVGKVDSVRVTASGLGATAGEAMSEAMKMALLQINGAVIQTSTVSVKYGLDITNGKDAASLRGGAFAEMVKQRSGGVIQNLRVLELQEPSEAAGNRFKASIEAEVAKFKPSADMQKIKVVVGQVRFQTATLPMGESSVSSADVGADLRQRISDALVNTGRFAVLDREFSADISQELDMISSGQAPSAELAKLSQAASADLVWSAKVSSLAYNRYARQLKTSNRELVSYSGGWAMSHKLVNVATRQVMASDSLQGKAPSTEATTLGAGVDGDRILGDMSGDLVNQVVTSILRRTFPVTVVARDGTNVVLSQGGQALKEGMRYAIVTMGNEMKDPQTGQSLGRMESPCCQLVVDQVTPNLSYGHLENVRSNLDQTPVGGLQMRGEIKGGASTAAAVSGAQGSASPAQSPGQEVARVPSGTAKPAPVRRVSVPTDASVAPASNRDSDKW